MNEVYEFAMFLLPAIAAGIGAGVIFQILDRLNLFYQTESDGHLRSRKAA